MLTKNHRSDFASAGADSALVGTRSLAPEDF
jgi:hypothetical protein